MRTSLPLGVPDMVNPSVYTLLLADILVGVALDRVAVPPAMDRAKSLVCNAPLPPVALYTASLMLTAMVALLEAMVTPEIVGANWSFRLTVLLLWVVLDSLPEPS